MLKLATLATMLIPQLPVLQAIEQAAENQMEDVTQYEAGQSFSKCIAVNLMWLIFTELIKDTSDHYQSNMDCHLMTLGL